MISTTAEYALRAVVCLADDPGTARTSRELARAARVPAGYLAKVLASLARAGIVRSRRGVNGGFALVGSPGEVTVLDVVEAVDPLRRIETCPLDLGAHATALCPLHRRLDEAIAATRRAFRATTIRSLVEPRGTGKPLCRPRGPGRRGAGGARD